MNKLLENKYIKKYQIYLIPIVGLLITILLLVLFIIPQIKTLSTLRGDIDQTNLQKEALEQKIASLKQVDQDDIKAKYEASLQVLPIDKNIPSAVSQLQVLASKSNVQITDLNISGQSPLEESVLFKAEIAGTLSSISSFLNQIKDGPRIMKVSGIEIAGGTAGNYLASITVTAYYQTEQGTIGNVDDPVVLLSDQEKTYLENLQKLSQTNSVNESTTSAQKGKSNPFE